MKRAMLIAALAVGMVLPTACREETTTTAPQPAAPPATASAAKEGEAGEHDYAGEAVLGTKSAGPYQVKAVQTGEYTDGEFDAEVTGGPGRPKAVRFWIGAEAADASAKAKASSDDGADWHGHPKVPKPLPEGAQFWVEVEPPSGPPARVGFDLKR